MSITASATPTAGTAQFGGAVSLLHNLILTRLYEGSYLDGNLLIADAALDTPIPLTLSLTNKGTTTTNVTSTVVIMTPPGATIATIPLGTVADRWRQRRESSRARSTPPLGVAPGRYAANATIHYDDNGVSTTRSFGASLRVGTPSLRLTIPPVQLSAAAASFTSSSAAPSPGTNPSQPTPRPHFSTPPARHSHRKQDRDDDTSTPAPQLLSHSSLEIPRISEGNYSLLVSVRGKATGNGLLVQERREAPLAAPVGKGVLAPGGAAQALAPHRPPRRSRGSPARRGVAPAPRTTKNPAHYRRTASATSLPGPALGPAVKRN